MDDTLTPFGRARREQQNPKDNPRPFGEPFKKDTWPESSGEVGRKIFKFGEKAKFVQDWPLGRNHPILPGKPWGIITNSYVMGEERPTLGSNELKVFVINKKGQLDFVPFFAVQKTGKQDFWFTLKWWLKIFLTNRGWKKSSGRFAGGHVQYVTGKVDSSATRQYYIGELLQFTDTFPHDFIAAWSSTHNYKQGEVYPTLGLYRAVADIPYIFRNKLPISSKIKFIWPSVLIVDALGNFVLVPATNMRSVGRYNIFFTIEYYVKILWDRLTTRYATL